MNAEDLAIYFSKKVANPIDYDVHIDDRTNDGNSRFYAIEPTAVRDHVLHALVMLKHEYEDGHKMVHSAHVGETAIPFEDGDTIEDVLDMALAATDFRNLREPPTIDGDRERMLRAFRKLERRQAALSSSPKP